MKKSASQSVYDFVVEQIKTKVWNQGDKISSENELASDLGVSRVAVRQALDKLVGIGLLNKQRGSGTYVANFDASAIPNFLIPIILIEREELVSLLEFRLFFEAYNIDLFVRRASDADIDELERIYEEMKHNRSNPDKFSVADFNFHKTIALGTRNTYIIRLSELLAEVLKNHQAHLYEDIGPDVGLKFHRRILEAVRDGDAELAGLHMKRHIQVTIDAVKALQA